MSGPPASERPARRSDPGPGLLDVRMHLHTPADPATATVVGTERCTRGRKAAAIVRHVSLDVSGTRIAGNFRPGQSFGVLAPGLDETGQPHKLRLYSISSPTRGEAQGGNVIATTVKRLIDEHWETHRLFLGVTSNFLCDLKPGDTLRITGPSGKRFVLPREAAAHDYLFFATGTGIAPFRGMVTDLLEAGVRSRIVLVMGAAYATDLLYDDSLRRLAAAHPNFRYLTAVSRERQEDGHGPMYVQDRLRTHREELGSLLASERGLVYVCGMAGMELGILQRMAEVLPGGVLSQYLEADRATLGNIGGWERRMVNREVRPTRRVFLEVY